MQRLASRLAQRRKISGNVWRVALAGAAMSGLSVLSGCNLINPPQLEPVPPAPPTPEPDIFDPADGVTALLPLPQRYVVSNILSGEVLELRTVTGVAPTLAFGTADPVRLAGIVTPAPGQPGYLETVNFIRERTTGLAGKQLREVSVEQDPRFPQDLDNRRLVQVYYTNVGGKLAGQKLSLNRMMIRQGYAVVDINAPTSIDVRPWLNDEEFARKKRLGLNRLGITIAQRIPIGGSGIVLRSPSRVVSPLARPGTRRRVRRGAGATSTTSTTTSGAAPGRPSGAPPEAPPPGGFGGRPPGSPDGPPPPGGPPPGGPGSASNAAPGGSPDAR